MLRGNFQKVNGVINNRNLKLSNGVQYLHEPNLKKKTYLKRYAGIYFVSISSSPYLLTDHLIVNA